MVPPVRVELTHRGSKPRVRIPASGACVRVVQPNHAYHVGGKPGSRTPLPSFADSCLCRSASNPWCAPWGLNPATTSLSEKPLHQLGRNAWCRYRIATPDRLPIRELCASHSNDMVGVRGFEPPSNWLRASHVYR